MGVVTINYDTLTLVVVLLFALVGFFRGWLKEGITTVLLTLLVGLLYNPQIVTPIVGWLNKLLRIVQLVVMDAGRFDLKAMAQNADKVPDVLLKDNPYNLLLWLLIILIALSYLGGKLGLGETKMTPLSHIIGGVAGALNGFIAISLFKEYLLRYLEGLTTAPGAAQAGAQAAAAAAKPGGLSVSVQNLPQQPFASSTGPMVIILLGVGMLVIIGSTVVTKMGKK
jgi:hypothetical protein